MLSWTYAGSEKDRVSADSRRQHTCSGDDVYDDELGKGVLDKLVGDTLYGYATALFVEFGFADSPLL